MSRAKITIGSAAYYTEVVAKGLDDYLSGAGEAGGEWTGAGAEHAGISGAVSAEQMGRLFESVDPCHPVTGEVLGGSYRVTAGVDKVSGWDLTLSAPKSFSTLWAVANRDVRRTLDDCHGVAVEAAVGFLEEHGAFSRKGHAGRFQVDTHGLVIARFDHRTSRAGDPQRHSHLLVSNRVQCRDGVWRALDSRALHTQLKAAGVVYQAALRAETTERVGVGWELADVNGQADIDGVPTGLVDRWSTRRNDLVERAADRIDISREALGRELTAGERRREFEKATLETRPAKTAIDRDVHERWMAEATEAGHDPDGWFDAAIGRGRDEAWFDEAGGVEAVGEMALDQLTETRSTWGRPDLVVAVASLISPDLATNGLAARKLIEQVTDDALHHQRVVALAPPIDFSVSVPLRVDGLPVDVTHDHARYATAEGVAREVEVLEFATQPTDGRGHVDATVVEAALVDTEEPVAKTRF